MRGNLRGRLVRLEHSTPAKPTSILANGRFWDMICGVSGECTPAELAEWEMAWRGSEEVVAGGDAVERLLAEVESYA